MSTKTFVGIANFSSSDLELPSTGGFGGCFSRIDVPNQDWLTTARRKMTQDHPRHPSRRSFLGGLAGLATSLSIVGQQPNAAPIPPAPPQDPFSAEKTARAIRD